MYPALAVIQAIAGDKRFVVDSVDDERRGSNSSRSSSQLEEVLWVGGIGGMEAELVKRAKIPYETIPAAGLHGVGWRNLPGNLWQIGRGFLAARRILRRYRPEVVFFTGGYIAVPMALASRTPMTGLRRPRILLHVPDIEPGMALKALSRFADRITLTAEDSAHYFEKNAHTVVTGYPTRQDLLVWNRQKAKEALGLKEDLPTLLVFGGSKGARSINRALVPCLPELLIDMQVVHISGNLDWPDVEEAKSKLVKVLPPEAVERYRPFAYLHEEMGAAMAAADLALSRAGASSLGEFPLFGLAAILVPYPYAWRYQQVNAEYMVRRGAAMIIQDEELPEKLLPEVMRLIKYPHKLVDMGNAMRALANPQAAIAIGHQLQELAMIHGGVQ